MSGWQGRAELVLQGRDFARITGAAAKVQSMAISQIGFGLSPEARTQAEGEAQAQAIEQFKARAATLARSFGFGGYTLREVAVQSSEGASGPHPRMMAMEAKAMALGDAAPVPVEAGKAQVEVSVSGSVQMR
jgi:predicted secreted protein